MIPFDCSYLTLRVNGGKMTWIHPHTQCTHFVHRGAWVRVGTIYRPQGDLVQMGRIDRGGVAYHMSAANAYLYELAPASEPVHIFTRGCGFVQGWWIYRVRGWSKLSTWIHPRVRVRTIYRRKGIYRVRVRKGWWSHLTGIGFCPSARHSSVYSLGDLEQVNGVGGGAPLIAIAGGDGLDGFHFAEYVL